MKLKNFAISFPLCYLVFFLCGVFLSACQITEKPETISGIFLNWKEQEVRSIDPIDSSNSASEIIAVYTRRHRQQIYLRLDFLNLPEKIDHEIHILISSPESPVQPLPFSNAAAVPWSFHLTFFPDGHTSIQTSKGIGRLQPSGILTARRLDSQIVIFDSSFIGISPHNYAYQVFTVDQTNRMIMDTSEKFSLVMENPKSASLALAFTETLPAQTPSQLLRRWNGAHTGPYGQRHGLQILLEGIEAHQIPVFLLDLKKPESQAGLNFLGETKWINSLEEQDLLILPDILSAETNHNFHTSAPRSETTLESQENFRYIHSPSNPGKISNAFIWTNLREKDLLVTWNNNLYIPLPTDQNDLWINRTGFTENFLMAVVNNALSELPGKIVIAGGSLPNSLWADKSLLDDLFIYLKSHPWIHILDGDSLSNIPSQTVETSPIVSVCEIKFCPEKTENIIPVNIEGSPIPSNQSQVDILRLVRNEIAVLAPSPLTSSLDVLYERFAQPTTNEQSLQLNANHLEILGHLIEAAKWHSSPYNISTCDSDIDWDGDNECILANSSAFVSFELAGGRVQNFIIRDEEDYVQIIGPSSQLAFGLSDPYDWNLAKGVASDPDTIIGAFINANDSPVIFQPESNTEKIRLTNPSGDEEKIFKLNNNILSITIQVTGQNQIEIPVLINTRQYYHTEWPDNFIYPDWAQGNQYEWQFSPELTVMMSLDNPSETTFTHSVDTREIFSEQEDANAVYAQGHFLPFPLTLINVKYQDQLKIYFSW
jgi:hypothetical protein